MLNKKGFTLIELMVVIVIIGVLAALAIPKFLDASVKAKVSEIPTVIGAWDHGILAYRAETGSLATATSEIVFDGPTSSKWFTYTHTGGGTAAAVYTAGIISGTTLGSIAGTATATSTINSTGDPAHNDGGFTEKYMPNFD